MCVIYPQSKKGSWFNLLQAENRRKTAEISLEGVEESGFDSLMLALEGMGRWVRGYGWLSSLVGAGRGDSLSTSHLFG